MLFPVTIYNANGKIKKVVSKEMLYRRHWEIFYNSEKKHPGSGKQRISKELKLKLDIQFPKGSMNSHN
jgi:hypothetical protein